MTSDSGTEARGATIIPTYTVRTPSGGWHLYYTTPPDPPAPHYDYSATPSCPPKPPQPCTPS